MAACALGFACGELASRNKDSTLPKAGSARDDGSGLLAAMSMRPVIGVDKKKGSKGGNNYAYKSDYGYGANGYGGSTYGGSIYSNYTFQANTNYRYSAPPNQYAVGYSIQTVDNGGSIEGTVTWPRAPKAKALPKLAASCDDNARNNTLHVRGGKVSGAVVYLEDIHKGRSHPSEGQSRKMQLGGLVVRGTCSMFPHVQVVAPIGASLTLRSGARGKTRTRVGYYAKPELGKSEGEEMIESPSRGSEREHRLDKGGFYAAVQTGQEDGAGAWIVVAGHPYYAVTNDAGRYELENIPPGTYTMVVWHPAVYLGDGKWMDPVVTRRKVTVKAYSTTSASVSLK